MARHEQLTVGQLTIETSIIDENGSTIIQDSASQSTLDSNATSRAVSTPISVGTQISSAVTAGSTVSKAVSVHADTDKESLIMSAALSDATSYNTLELAYRSSIVTNAASLSSVNTNNSSIVVNVSGVLSGAQWDGGFSVTGSDLLAGSSLTSAISNAVASFPSEGTDISRVLSATQSGATDATNSTNVSTLDSEMSLVTSSAASELAYRSSIVTNTAYDSSIVTNSTTGSSGLNWDETTSEFGSMITQGSILSVAGSAILQSNVVFGKVWWELASAIESAGT